MELLKRFINSNVDIKFARFAVILVLVVMGNYKWFEFEVLALKPLFASTWLSFLPAIFGDYGASYFLGVIEAIAYISLIVGFKKPKFGVFGDFIVIIMSLTTLSLLPQLGKLDGFIFKDIFLLALALVLLRYDLVKILKR